MPSRNRQPARTSPDVAPVLRQRIEARLIALDVSSFQASEAIGMHRNFVYDLLVGRKSTMGVHPLGVLATYLGVSPAWLTGEGGDAPASPVPAGQLAG